MHQLVKIITSLLCFGIIVYFIPLEKVSSIIYGLELRPVVFAFILILLNIFLSSIRFSELVTKAGISISFITVHKINIFSQIFGLLALQTLGQMAFRNAYGMRFTTFPQRFAFLTLIEKSIAVLILLLIASLGAMYVTKNIFSIKIALETITIVIVAIVSSALMTYFLVFTQSKKKYIRKIIVLFKNMGLAKVTLFSLVMHFFMLAAYVFLAKSFLKDIPFSMLAAIFSIVMLGASIPISFAGWGVRELSAGFIFTFLGYDPIIGVLVATLIGVFYLIAIGLNALFVIFFQSNDKNIANTADKPPLKKEFHFEKALAFVSMIFITILIGMQIRIPTNTGKVTLNLADPIAFVVALSFIVFWYHAYLHQAIFRIRGFGVSIALFIVMIFYGWVLGYMRFGPIDWAVYNRLLGLLVILSYFFSGCMIASIHGKKIIGLIISIFLISTLFILFLYISTFHFLDSLVLKEFNWSIGQFNGFLQNRNALAFVLVLCLTLSMSFPKVLWKTYHHIVIGFFCGLIILTFSRTGIIVGGISIILGTLFGLLRAKELFRVFGWALTLICITYAIGHLFLFLNSSSELNNSLLQNVPTERFLQIHSERTLSYKLGYEMWLSHPIFGAGLGAFISEHIKDFKNPLTIHNSVLWLLAEMGIVGFLLFLFLPMSILVHLWRQRLKLEWADFSLLLFLVSIAIFSLAHEILYQRFAWFILGILVTNKLCLNDKSSYRKSLTFKNK